MKVRRPRVLEGTDIFADGFEVRDERENGQCCHLMIQGRLEEQQV